MGRNNQYAISAKKFANQGVNVSSLAQNVARRNIDRSGTHFGRLMLIRLRHELARALTTQLEEMSQKSNKLADIRNRYIYAKCSQRRFDKTND